MNSVQVANLKPDEEKARVSFDVDATLGVNRTSVIESIHSGTTVEHGIGSHRLSVGFGDRSERLTKRLSVAKSTHKLEILRTSIVGRGNEKRMTLVVDPEESNLDGKEIFANYDYTKHANTVFRWNLLWIFIILGATYPLWATFINCKKTQEVTIIISAFITLNYTFTFFLNWRYMWRMIRSFNTPYWQELDPKIREKVQHIVVMPTYKEPIELLMETISSVANQSVASSIIMVVGMEEKTPHQDQKKEQIRKRFDDSFKALVFAVHPSGTPGEIPGACSNRNYAARAAVKYMIQTGLLEIHPVTKEADLDFTTCTVCDSDTTFYYKYFESLTWSFLNENPETRYKVCWQSPLFYNISLDERWWFTRGMHILRSYFMVGFLIGVDINTMSIYSMSLRLLVEGQFFHPGYQMDDIIYTLSCMRATGSRIRIRTIDIPTLSGPTSGVTMADEFKEFVVQGERWTIGAAEVFHYFFVKLIKCNYFIPGLQYFWWFVYYYGFILCFIGVMSICNIIMVIVGTALPQYAPAQCKPMSDWFDLSEDFSYDWLMNVWLLCFYILVAVPAFFMDALISQILALDEYVNPIRNLLHLIFCQLALWVYGLIEFYAIIKISIYGKKVCGHKASEKHALAGKKEGDVVEGE